MRNWPPDWRYPRISCTTAGAAIPAGYLHLPKGAEAELVRQLVAEQLVTVTTRRGFQRLEWQKLRERNEVLDCRVYARAAAWIAGVDRWTDEKWRDLEAQVGPASEESTITLPDDVDPPPDRPAGVLRRPPPRRHRVFRSSYLG